VSGKERAGAPAGDFVLLLLGREKKRTTRCSFSAGKSELFQKKRIVPCAAFGKVVAGLPLKPKGGGENRKRKDNKPVPLFAGGEKRGGSIQPPA